MRLNLSYLAPSALLAEARRELAAVTNEKLFNSSNYEKSRENWCAGMLGLGYEKFVAPCRVAVNDSREQIEADLFLRQRAVKLLSNSSRSWRKVGAAVLNTRLSLRAT